MLRLLLIVTLALLAACKAKNGSVGADVKAGFTKEASRNAYEANRELYADAPLLLRFPADQEVAPPAEWKAPVFREETGKLEITQGEDGTVATNHVPLAVSPTNAYIVSYFLTQDALEMPLPFDSDLGSLPKWEKLIAAFQENALSNVFIREAFSRAVLRAPQRAIENTVAYEDFHEAFLFEKALGTPTGKDLALVWARTYFYLRKAVREKDFELVKKIALEAEDIEGVSPEWEAMQAEALLTCDPTRQKEIHEHYDKAMRLYAKRSRGIPFYRVWVEKTALDSLISDSETVVSRYYAILRSLEENEKKGLLKSDFSNAIKEQIYINMTLLLIRYDQPVNASMWAKRLFSQEFSREAKIKGLDLLFKSAEKTGAIFETIETYDKLIDEVASVEEKNFWRLEKGAALQRFDLIEEASRLYADILKDDPNIEKRQFALDHEKQDARFMHLHYYVLRASEDDMRDLELSNLRKRGILDRENASYYLRQAAQLLVCMQRLKEAYNIYESICRSDDMALLEYVYLLYRNGHYDKCVQLMRRLPVHRSSDLAKDWRLTITRLFRSRRIRPEVWKVVTEFSKITNEVTRARFCNGLGNIYQAYRDSAKAAAYYEEGIKTDPMLLDNYLDRGFLYCMSANKEKANEILDTILAMDLTPNQKEMMRYDWRAIELYYTAGREMPEEDYE